MPMAHVNGVDINYIVEGDQAAPPVLLIHGFASNLVVNWVDPGWLRHLVREGFRVIALDNRGHGQSQKLYEPDDYGAAHMAGDAAGLLEHLRIGRAHVIGYSMGTRISAFLALNHPHVVDRMVFGGLGYNMVRGLAGTGPIATALLAPSIAEVTNPTARTFRAFADATGGDLRALAACIRNSRDPITAAMVREIQAPVLVAVGDEDVIGGSAQGLADLIPGAKALVLEGRDHMKAVGDRRFKEGAVAWLRGGVGGVG